MDWACSRGFGETGAASVAEGTIVERGQVVSSRERSDERMKAKATF